MKKIPFDTQACIVFALLGLGHLLAWFLQQPLWVNGAWVLCGALFAANPQCPEVWKAKRPNGWKLEVRLAGAVIILMGLLMHGSV